jgi:RHS repeat-associated protein
MGGWLTPPTGTGTPRSTATGARGELTRVIDPLGKETQLFYSGYGSLAAVQDPAGRRVNTGWHYAALFRFIEPDGTIAFDGHFYNHQGRWFLETWWAAGGDRGVGAHTGFTVAYDPWWKLASVTAPQVNTTDAGTTRPVTSLRSLEAAVLPAAGTGTAGSPAPRLQPHEVRVEVTDPRGNVSRMALDPFGAPTRVEEPLGRVTSIFRDRHGRVMRTDAHSGHIVLNEYVGVQLRKVTDATTGAVVNAEYEPVFNQPTHVWGTGTTEVWNTYDTADPQRKLLTTRSGTAASPVTSYSYTTRGRVSSVTDPEGHGSFIEYGDVVPGGNPWGNTQKVSVGTASRTYRRTTTLMFDGYGRTITSISPGSDTTRTVYDLNNRVTRSISAQHDTTYYEHRPTGLYRVTDPKGQSYVFNRNLLGWVESEIDPRNQYTYYGYNRSGAATSMTNRRGQTVTSTYDALGRVETRNADGQQTTWSYDPAHRWVQAGNAESTNRTEYDATGRATRVITTLGGVAYTQEIGYDAEGRRNRMDVSGPWTGTRGIGYTYNARGQLDTLTDIAGGITTLTYNDDGQLERRVLPNGAEVVNGYVSTHAPFGIEYNTHYSHRLSSSYHYDDNGRVDARRTIRPFGAQLAEYFRRYAYNRRGHLTQWYDEAFTSTYTHECGGTTEEDPDGGVCIPTDGYITAVENYTYDRAGNRTDRGSVIEAGNRITAFDGYQFTYNADGNLLGKLKPNVDQLSLAWNSLGQVTGAWRAGYGSITYGYDAFGRRVRRTAPDGSVTRYLYDGDDLLMELDGAGNPVREYTYYPGIDNPHSLRVSATGASYYYATESPGNVVGLMDGIGQQVNEYRHGPWGRAELVQEGVPQPLRFGAREWDGGSGLYQVRARWYDPQTGRFVSEDPIGLAGGMNVYTYAANNPVNFTDPSGLCPEEASRNNRSVREAANKDCPFLLDLIVAESGRSSVWSMGSYISNRGSWGFSFGGEAAEASFTGGGFGGAPAAPSAPAPIVQCPNTTWLERHLARRADVRSSRSGTEEGYFVAPRSLWYQSIDGPNVRKGPRYIEATPPFWAATMIHNHPSGRGISVGDSVYAYTYSVRVVSGSARTNVFGAINPGGARSTCITLD